MPTALVEKTEYTIHSTGVKTRRVRLIYLANLFGERAPKDITVRDVGRRPCSLFKPCAIAEVRRVAKSLGLPIYDEKRLKNSTMRGAEYSDEIEVEILYLPDAPNQPILGGVWGRDAHRYFITSRRYLGMHRRMAKLLNCEPASFDGQGCAVVER